MKRYNTVEAIKKAILRGEHFYNEVVLPSGQRAGTYFQKATYAYLKAEKIYEKHFNNHSN